MTLTYYRSKKALGFACQKFKDPLMRFWELIPIHSRK